MAKIDRGTGMNKDTHPRLELEEPRVVDLNLPNDCKPALVPAREKERMFAVSEVIALSSIKKLNRNYDCCDGIRCCCLQHMFTPRLPFQDAPEEHSQ